MRHLSPPPPKKNRFISLHCNFARDIVLFAQTTVKYFISPITQCAVYPITFVHRAPCFAGRESRTTYRSAETSHIPSFLPNSGAETNYDFVKLETPWRESRERRSPRERSLPDTHSVFAGWFVFLPATFLPR